MARRRTRNAVDFNAASILERIEELAIEVERSFGEESMVFDRVHGFELRLNDALRNVRHLSHLLGSERHDNIANGLHGMLRSLRQMARSGADDNSYTAHRLSQGEQMVAYAVQEIYFELFFRSPWCTIFLLACKPVELFN